jgi:hypothetical protein
MSFNPAQYKVSMRLPSFDGGLNTKFTDVSTPLNASPDLSNVLFDDYGAVRTARGYQKFNSAAIASAPIDGLSTYLDISGDRILMAACNGGIYQQNGTTFSIISGTTAIYTAGVDIKFLNVNSWSVFGNGWINLYKWDGTNLFRFGAQPPTGIASATIGAGDIYPGAYSWGISYVNSAGVESDVAPIITSYALGSTASVTISGIPVAPASFGVDAVNLYRTTAAAGSIYWLVTAMSGAQTSVVDNNANTSLILQAPSDHGTPPRAKYMVYYRGRMFAAGDWQYPYRLYYSNGGAVEEWPSTNFLDVEDGDGQPISAIEAFGNSIIIHKNDGKGAGAVYLLYIADSTGISDDQNWYMFKSPAAFSAVSDKSQSFFRNLLFYVNRYGAFAFTGQDLARSSADSEYGRFQSDALSYDIDADVKAWSPNLLSRSASIAYDNKVYLAVPSNATTNQNNKIYVFDFVRMSGDKIGVWSRLTAPAVNNFVVSDGTLYAGGYSGYVYKMDTGTLNDGSAIAPYYWTAAISGLPEHRDNSKIFRILYVTHELSGNWNLYVDYQVDFGGATQTGTISLNPGGTLWGGFLWKVGTWGGGSTSKRSRLILPLAVGKVIKFKFYVTGANETFKIKEIELDYNLRSKRG